MNRQAGGEREIFQRQTNAGVVQDKKPPGRLTARRGEPASAAIPAVGSKGGSATILETAPAYTGETQSAVDRPTHHGSETRRTEQVTGRILPVLKTQLLQLAKQRGARNESTAVKMAVEVFVANEFGKQFLTMIRQTIQETVRQEFTLYTNRIGKVSFYGYLAAEQGRMMHIDHLRATLPANEFNTLSRKITSFRQQALENLKFYNYSLTDIEEAVSETVPWQ
jgi:hypothetical protein